MKKIDRLNMRTNREIYGSEIFTPITCETTKIVIDKHIRENVTFAIFLGADTSMKIDKPIATMADMMPTTL